MLSEGDQTTWGIGLCGPWQDVDKISEVIEGFVSVIKFIGIVLALVRER